MDDVKGRNIKMYKTTLKHLWKNKQICIILGWLMNKSNLKMVLQNPLIIIIIIFFFTTMEMLKMNLS